LTAARLLVTAIDGDLGQSTVKALRLGGPRFTILGCDVGDAPSGEAFVDGYRPVPRADDPRYLDTLAALCVEMSIDAVLPSSEAEIQALSRGELTAAAVVGPGAEVLGRLGDKLDAMRSVSDSVPLAPYCDGTDAAAVDRLVAEAGFPLVVKPRRSSGSRNVVVVDSDDELRAMCRAVDYPLVQGYIPDTDGEYSIGVYRGQQIEAAIVLRRWLRPPLGLSWEAETVDMPEVVDYALRIARAVDATGAINVQVRISDGQPLLLEVNPRLSSLVAARAAAGFEDARWWVHDTLGIPTGRVPATWRPVRFARIFHELLDTGSGWSAPPEWAPRAERS
jgi:carbamoyl-phosphate synthase large subunit